MKLIGYCRVSTDRQAKFGVSLAAQEDRIKAYATFADAEIVGIEVDRGYSGKRTNRPAFQRAIARVVAGEADALIVYSIDRLARSSLDFLQTVERLQKADRGFVSCREQLDSTTPHGRFTLTILAALAQMESELNSERGREAKARCRVEGRALNARTYGFHNDEAKKLIESPREMEIVEQILAYRDADVTYQGIADLLNDGNVPSARGLLWARASVRSVEQTHRSFRRSVEND